MAAALEIRLADAIGITKVLFGGRDVPVVDGRTVLIGRVVSLLLPAPLFFITIHALVAHLRHGDPLLGLIVDRLVHTPLWLRLLLLIPFTTTLLSLYKARVHFESDIHLRAQRRFPKNS